MNADAEPTASPTLALESVAGRILVVRGQRVLLDQDLAQLYGVATKVLVQAVKRNIERFPEDFAFRLSADEFSALRSRIVTSSWGGRRFAPFVFTEQGVAMLSGVLNSPRAIAVNIEVMRTFVRLREMLGSNKALAARFDELERKLAGHDHAIASILEAIRSLMAAPSPPRRPIGFVPPKDRAPSKNAHRTRAG